MKSMKSKIKTPFLVLIILFPLVIIFLFNAAVRIYIERDTRGELRTVISMMETVERSDPKGNWLNFTSDGYDRALAKLYRLISATNLAVNVDLHLFSRNHRLIYSFDEAEDATDNQILSRIENRLFAMQEKKIYTIHAGAQRYLVTAYPLSGSGAIRPTIVIVAYMTEQTSWLRAVNLILAAITLMGAVAAVLIANRLSSEIAKPVTELSDMTRQIGRGTYPCKPGEKDILELNMLHQSIFEMSERLAANDRTQRTFLQNASHELKTPLMSIQGYAEGIEKGIITDVKRAAELIGNESKRLATLVEQLLTLSRIESQTYIKELTAINLCDVLKEYGQRMGGLAAKHGKQLLLDLPEADLYVRAEDTLLSQAVINIVSNGLRYSKTAVCVNLLRKGSSAVIRISDDGCGIPQADLPRIFERFYKGQQGNLGLGLAIAKSAVETMGGHILAFNDAAGAVFEITLPILGVKNQ